MMIIQCISSNIGDKNNEKDTFKYMHNSKIKPLNLIFKFRQVGKRKNLNSI